jgi:hypothetical protein
VPIIERVANGSPFFDDLSEDSAEQVIVVKTVEEIGSDPWLGDLTAEHASITIARRAAREAPEESAGIVRRTYEYTISWRNVPAQREVRSRIHAPTNIDPEPGVFIGSVSAIIQANRFRPTVVHLQKGKVGEDLVVFSQAAAFSSWRIAENTKLPAWLSAEWQDREGTLALHVSLTNMYDGAEPRRFQIPLIQNDGATDYLDVVAFPGS